MSTAGSGRDGVDALLGMVAPPTLATPAAGGGPARATGPGSLTGQEWDGYRIGVLLGRGGMGEVYRAVQRGVERAVAFKVLADAVEADAEYRQRFANEARAAALVDSPHVVRVHGSGEHGGRPWLAMELVDGPTLAEELARRAAARTPFTPQECAALARQAAMGLAAAHACRLVHRDIKPGNMLIGPGGVLKLADFGLVRRLDAHSLTRTGAVLGTPAYLSPEQGRGLDADARSDLYSLGAVLYELLTLRPPFRAENADGLIFKHNFAEPELPCALNPDVPQDLQAVCLKCLQKDPAARFASAADLADDLGRVLAGLAPRSAVFAPGRVGTGAAAALRRLAGWRRRGWPIALGLAAALLALAGGWWWWDARKAEIAQVRGRLEALAARAPVPDTAAADLARLARLAGPADPQVAAGRGKLERVAAAAEDLRAALAVGDPDRGALAAQGAAVAALAALVGEGDARVAQGRARLAAAAAREAALRARLAARLDGVELAPDALRGELAAERAAWNRLVAEDDPQRRTWAALDQRSEEAKAADRARLARLDEPAPLRADELADLRAAAERLAHLAPADAALAGVRRLEAEAAAIAERQAVLARAEERMRAEPAQRAVLGDAIGWLEARAAIDPARARRLRGQLGAIAAELAGLAARLAVLDAPRSLPEGLGEALDRYEALAGFQDPRAAAWRRRYAEVRLLQERLAPLERPRTPPAGAAADLARLAELVGADDRQVAAGRDRLARVAAARAGLAGLDRAAPPPAGTAAALDRLGALVGEEDPGLVRWRARLAEHLRLAARLDAWDGLLSLDAGTVAGAAADLAAYRALAGDGGGRTARAARRLAALQGPPRPAWAAGEGWDRHGRWCDLACGGATQRLRWLPPTDFTLGSPPDEAGRDADEAPVRVRLTHGLWVGDSECAQDLYAAVTGRWPARRRDPRGPVEQVDHAQAEAFCAALAARLPDCPARLPSEAEWECALRAGSAAPWGAIDPQQVAGAVVHAGAAGPLAVGSGSPNPLGLHDGPGNLWEWCRGAYAPPPAGDLVEDPLAVSGPLRPARGGSWIDPLPACRLANRVGLDGATSSPALGFRFVVEAGGP